MWIWKELKVGVWTGLTSKPCRGMPAWPKVLGPYNTSTPRNSHTWMTDPGRPIRYYPAWSPLQRRCWLR